MAEENDSEKTEQPTPKRLQQAKEKGQVPRSRELISVAILMAGSIAAIFLSASMLEDVKMIFHDGLALDRHAVFHADRLIQHLINMMLHGFGVLVPIFVLMVFVALVSPVALGGYSFSLDAIKFKYERIDPIKGLKRIFSVRGLVELMKALLKFVLVAVAVFIVLGIDISEYMNLGRQNLRSGVYQLIENGTVNFLIFSAALIVIATFDVPFQLYQHEKQLRMSKQEVKDEMKETDGKPEVKQKIRQAQKEISKRRMMAEVPKADVVITNPSHYACAIRYDNEKTGAPRLVAKGKDFIALQIRNTALMHNIPVVTAPPLARAIYFNTKLDHQIPEDLYLAVAKVLAYLYQLDARKKTQVIKMDGLPVPQDLSRSE